MSNVKMLRALIRECLLNEDNVPSSKLSDNLLNRLEGFLEEIQSLLKEIVGNGKIWASGAETSYEIVNSCIDQLIHLSGELSSLSRFIERRYHDRVVTNNVSALAKSLSGLKKQSTSKLGRFFKSNENYIESLRESYDEINTRLRTCQNSIKRMRDKSAPIDIDLSRFK